MKVLLSAYACEPNRGSEPGLGWNWAMELTRQGYQVWVLTKANNQSAIEAELSRLGFSTSSLHFIYYDLPCWARFWKKGTRGVHIYNVLWQVGAYFVVRRFHRLIKFDVAHHVTFGSIRHPSLMGLLGIPFIFGPVGGAEKAPLFLRKTFPLKGKLIDFLRDIQALWVRIDPLMQMTFKTASRIYVTSWDNLNVIPKQYRNKTEIQLAVCANPEEKITQAPQEHDNVNQFKILYIGRLIYWKGVHLAIEAFAQFSREHPNTTMTIIGRGSEENWLRSIAKKHGVHDSIQWKTAYMDRSELLACYGQFDVFLFPSLHESGGTVVLESFTNGLPVICFDLGGPGIIGSNDCGRVVVTKNSSYRNVIKGLVNALHELAAKSDEIHILREAALQRAKEFQWDKAVFRIYDSLSKSGKHYVH